MGMHVQGCLVLSPIPDFCLCNTDEPGQNAGERHRQCLQGIGVHVSPLGWQKMTACARRTTASNWTRWNLWPGRQLLRTILISDLFRLDHIMRIWPDRSLSLSCPHSLRMPLRLQGPNSSLFVHCCPDQELLLAS